MMTEDDFEYIPLKKKIRKKQENNTNKPECKKDPLKKKSASKKDTKKEDSRIKSCPKSSRKKQTGKSPARERKKYDGHCPNCQMPFSILVIESPSWHASECVASFKPESECPDGSDCSCTIQNHYWKFGHSQLAEYRAYLSKRNKTEQEGKRKLNLEQHTSNGKIENCTEKNSSFSVDVYHSTSKANSDVRNTASSMPSMGQDKSSPDSDELIDLTLQQSPLDPTVLDTQSQITEEQVDLTPIQSSPDANTHQTLSQNTKEQVDLTPIQSSQDANTHQTLSQNTEEQVDLSPPQSPQDLTDYLEKAFKEATYCSQENVVIETQEHVDDETQEEHVDNGTHNEHVDDDTICEDNLNSCERYVPNFHIHGSDNITEMESSTLDDQSIVGQSDCNKDEDIISNFLSDASQDTNSNQSTSFFERYKTKIKLRDNAEKSQLDDSVKQHIFQGINEKSQEEGSLDGKSKTNSENSYDVKIEKVETACNQVLAISLSQGSQVSDPVHTEKGTRPRMGAKSESNGKRGKLKSLQKSDTMKQTSLFSFFQGNEKPSMKENSYEKSEVASENCKLSTSMIDNTCGTSHDTTEGSKKLSLRNANDILMKPIKKSDSECSIRKVNSCETSQDSSENGKKVRNANDILMNSMKRADSDSTCMKLARSSSDIPQQWKTYGKLEKTETEDSGKFKRYCPFYKKMPDTGFTVDAFCYGEVKGCCAYFLSHFHFDHYRGLTRKFSQPIYCSKITGNLVRSRLGVRPDLVNDLPMNTPCKVNDVEVTLLEANHCPGSVLFLFRTKSGRLILHTGDFRADPSMEQIPSLQKKLIHELYLDTTYCDPTYAFPPQKEVVDFVISFVKKILSQNAETLIVCGSYTIGKERIFTAIANTFDCKICVQKDKFKVLECLEDTELTQRLSLDFNDSFLHVLPMSKLKVFDLDKHVSSLKRKFENVVAIEPTGWTFNKKMVSLDQIKPKGNKKIQIYGIPYSEHSSFLELKRFVQYFKPMKILPTVNNGNPTKRKQMQDIFNSWLEEVKRGN